MEQPDDVVPDVVETRRIGWRGALVGVGLGLAAGLLSLFAPQAAHADEADPGLLGGLLSGVASTVTDVTRPVTTSLPDARDLPVVGHLVGELADSGPVVSVTQPVAGLVDGLLGDTVASLPVVGGILGDEPVHSILDPLAGTVDDTLVGVVGEPGTSVGPGTPAGPDIPGSPGEVPVPAPSTDEPRAASVLLGLGAVGLIADAAADVAAGSILPIRPGPAVAPLGVLGDAAPASVVAPTGPSAGLVAALLGGALFLLLARGQLRPGGIRAPESPVYPTDTSPD
jgi:hypothetical protein